MPDYASMHFIGILWQPFDTSVWTKQYIYSDDKNVNTLAQQ